MIDSGKRNLLGVLVNVIDYDGALHRIRTSARQRTACSVTALAVHGVMTGYEERDQQARLNGLDLVVPDGQPVRWALNLLHQAALKERVYGPTLMLKTCEMAEKEGFGIYLFGSTALVLDDLQRSLRARFPELRICGVEPSRFRQLSAEEKYELADRITTSGADIAFVGLGCPRQEAWAFEYRNLLTMPIIAVGAAFAFHSGSSRQAPRWMQDWGLEWLFRLASEPRRLWRRYLLLNPHYIALVAAQLLRLRRFHVRRDRDVSDLSYG